VTPGEHPNKIEGLTTPFILTVAVLVGVIVAALITIVPRTMRNATLEGERRNAIEQAEQFRLTHERYVQATRAPGRNDSVPMGVKSPGQFQQDLARDTRGRETRFRVVSPYPYGGRDEAQWNEFAKQAWEVFRSNPDAVFTQDENIDGQRFLRLAIAQTMSATSCVECHNADPRSPKRDWHVGDVAGLVDVLKLVEPNLQATDRYASTIVSFVVASGVFAAILVILLNISSVRRARERDEARKRIEYLAYYDTLTGALNRGHFLGLLAEWLKSPEARARGVAIHFVDLDKFKEVNDTLGHDVGDDLVREATARLIALAGQSDLVGRVGGDEFVMAQWKVASRKHVEERAAAIVHALSQPFNLRGNRISISASVGVVDRFVTSSATELMKCADLALYRAKALGRNRYVIFNRQIEEERAAKLLLEHRVREALETNAFRLFFQPICRATDGLIVGFETLIRLFDENGQSVSTQQFVNCAESMGLITHIDEWVLRNACQAAASWPGDTTVAVNLSPANFGRASITGRQLRRVVSDVLAETGLEAHRLELEITEGILLENTEDVLQELHGLKELGASISLDDFGAGYSSMSYLWKFPFDKLKIDGSFVRDAHSVDTVIPAILRAIISLGRDLRLKVCAEGVETAEQRDLIVALGADQIQGYFYGRPTDRDDVAALLLKNFRDHSVRPGAPRVAAVADRRAAEVAGPPARNAASAANAFCAHPTGTAAAPAVARAAAPASAPATSSQRAVPAPTQEAPPQTASLTPDPASTVVGLEEDPFYDLRRSLGAGRGASATRSARPHDSAAPPPESDPRPAHRPEPAASAADPPPIDDARLAKEAAARKRAALDDIRASLRRVGSR
jgi:diguanylate cyclase (GGDEF)-like protein